MPRPIFGVSNQHASAQMPYAPIRSSPTASKLQVSLRRRRKEFLSALKGLDAQGRAVTIDLAALKREIDEEFRPMIDALPIGFVSRCYLGRPFEVHVLNLTGDIVEHYELGRSMPSEFERGRRLATHPAYSHIEIYPTMMICVRNDGSVTEVAE